MQFIDVVVGGQYGSEAKGHVTAKLVRAAVENARQAAPALGGVVPDVINVRVAGPNAGHTAYDLEGRAFAFRSLPVGAVVDPDVKLYIAPGSEVDLDVLYDEIMQAEAAGHLVRHRLFVSRQATLLTQNFKDAEVALVGSVGSTGKGIGAARAARLMRTAQTLGDYFDLQGEDGQAPWWGWREPEDLYAHDNIAHDQATHVIVEGTQGFGLSLRASGHYPQVTSSDARAIDFLAMAGIDPLRCSVQVSVWVVARVFPIRVAGNSGPMKGETTWEELGLPEERTTVTKKVRRVGAWDPELLERAVQANGGHRVKLVITMLDQLFPELRVIDPERFSEDAEYRESMADVMNPAVEWMNTNVTDSGVSAPVAGFTFGPDQMLFTAHAQGGREPGEQDGPTPEQAEALLRTLLGGA